MKRPRRKRCFDNFRYVLETTGTIEMGQGHKVPLKMYFRAVAGRMEVLATHDITQAKKYDTRREAARDKFFNSLREYDIKKIELGL